MCWCARNINHAQITMLSSQPLTSLIEWFSILFLFKTADSLAVGHLSIIFNRKTLNNLVGPGLITRWMVLPFKTMEYQAKYYASIIHTSIKLWGKFKCTFTLNYYAQFQPLFCIKAGCSKLLFFKLIFNLNCFHHDKWEYPKIDRTRNCSALRRIDNLFWTLKSDRYYILMLPNQNHISTSSNVFLCPHLFDVMKC